MKPYEKIVSIIVIVACIVYTYFLIDFYNKNVLLKKQILTTGKETAVVTITIHDTIHDTIPFAQIVYSNKIINKAKYIAKDSLAKQTTIIPDSTPDTTSCFEFTKNFDEGTVNVEMCSKYFTSKYEDISANIWFLAIPDTTFKTFRVDTLTLIQQVPDRARFWKYIAIGASCLAGGYIIGVIRK